ncbi:haloacid dehalogenase [Suicoccus acidiformans]|uniref:Haloacid dehalogenase n=1 Tax=Suicoccus acidiformans TaxID=2036206 RepID=A0A347WKT7_9LACT|nr:Cof-type HAD-IIB family hydrolase [Suicoccus acidiformans]AXY25694.1 haloacid dehalogenase [Suicoccus acidiformans]
MKRHLIAIDLDGTTLNDESKLSVLTIQTLRRLNDLGHMVMIVTGRPYRNSKAIYRQIGIDSPMVNFNGALCHFPGNDHWLPYYHEELDREIAFELFNHQDELDISLLIAEGKEHLYTTSAQLPDSPFYPIDQLKISRLSRESLTYNPTALSIFCDDAKQETIETELMKRYGDTISVRTWGGILPVLEVVRAGINKAVGVQRVADFYHIPQDCILAFGDENNDYEMIQYAGLGVAMANATDEIKSIADTQTERTNDEDGLAHFLLDYFDITL